ncbi:hypothetical protein RHMOL_Rhmol01G0085300 [Rhododendron molle]|uniref:Uncharacterized protein n=1 Tax=Rhododendron molle TaxID=49168 RepID=A0ACC0Q2D1_RHOML|nr:hypothetical protein RHMOL_Rhmol01G0085300 [Rhododendron molle]
MTSSRGKLSAPETTISIPSRKEEKSSLSCAAFLVPPSCVSLHLAWGVISEGVCGLCGTEQETHDHLLFQCDYSAAVWSHFLQVNGVLRGGFTLRDEIAWMSQHSNSSSFKNSVLKLSLASVVYGLWRERNCRVFKRQSLHCRDLILKITADLRACFISRRRVTKSDENHLIFQAWHIPSSVFASLVLVLSFHVF